MPRPRYPATTFQGSADEVEAAFYEALQTASVERLMACWSDDEDVVCVHPGGPRVLGNTEIRASFEAIFTNGGVPAQPERVQRVEAMGCSVHNLIERIDVMTDDGPRQAWVVATNVYVKTPQGWRMVAHHASPASVAEAGPAATPPQTLH